MKTLNWHGCYKGGWRKEIVPDAYQHPAKFSRKLIAHIYDHLIAEGLIKRGDSVIDPFGGVALGALDAMRLGLHWTGNELELKFVHLGRANIELWNARYSSMPNWGTAQLLHGDSRKLAEIVRSQRCAVSSPPYAHIAAGAGGLNTKPARNGQQGGRNPNSASQSADQHYGATDGQLSILPEGDFSAVVSSPPYADGCAHNGGDDPHPDKMEGGEYHGVGYNAIVSSPPYEEARIGETSGAANVGHNGNYGASAGQLGSMTGGDFSAAVSSPPYESAIAKRNAPSGLHGGTFQLGASLMAMNEQGYAKGSESNIGNDSGETFWLAARTIVEQTYAVLAPRGLSVWVCKDFVRNKERVPFCDQWRQLCEVVGFEHLYTARAWLVEENGTQLAHDGKHKNLRKERKSFFRRLNEKNGGPRIDFEQVIFLQKP